MEGDDTHQNVKMQWYNEYVGEDVDMSGYLLEMQGVWLKGFHPQLMHTGRGSSVSSCCAVLDEHHSCTS